MVSKNDITGDSIITKSSTQNYRDGWEMIFGNRSDVLDELTQLSEELGLYEERELPKD